MAVVVAVVAGALPLVLPLQWMLTGQHRLGHARAHSVVAAGRRAVERDLAARLLVVGCLAAGALFLFFRAGGASSSHASSSCYLVMLTTFAERQWELLAGRRAPAGGLDRPRRSAGSDVAIVYTGHVRPAQFWENRVLQPRGWRGLRPRRADARRAAGDACDHRVPADGSSTPARAGPVRRSRTSSLHSPDGRSRARAS